VAALGYGSRLRQPENRRRGRRGQADGIPARYAGPVECVEFAVLALISASGIQPQRTIQHSAERRAKDAGVDAKFAVADSTKLDGYTDAFDTVIDSGVSTH
jgi:hypothetical protein